MSGLFALLDDVAAIAKVAATSVDDVATQALKASSKAAGAVIDDAAVTPKYVHGFHPARELPIIWKIARGSFINKLLILLPAGLLLSNFAPWAIWPLLLLGGLYLCFEGAEKLYHAFFHHDEHAVDPSEKLLADQHLEKEKVEGAIKTDFILSAEIMTIALSAIPQSTFWMEAATLAAVAILITVAVYGVVALIVKMDDVGLWMVESSRTPIGRNIGLAIVKFMPVLLKLLTIIGTAAMLWVGGSIIVHSVAMMGWHLPEEVIHHWAEGVAHVFSIDWQPAIQWIATAAMDGVLGVILGFIMIPIGTKFVGPIWSKLFSKKAA